MAIIIGSGAGAGLVAAKLVKAGIPTTILEKGLHTEPKDAFEQDDINYVGGLKDVAMANMSMALEDELKSNGLDISKEISTVEGLVEIKEIDASTISDTTKKFIDIAKNKELSTKIVGKSVDLLGQEFINAGFDYALTIINDAEDIEIVAEKGNIVGVKYVRDGIDRMKYSKTVIIATDSIDTPILLKDAGVETSKDVKYNSYITVRGDLNSESNDVAMNVVASGDGYSLIPYYTNDTVSIMVKSDDVSSGSINDEGVLAVSADATLEDGVEIAKSILEELGASNITVSETKAANTVGSASVGNIVNSNLETEVTGLFVCDISVLPIIPEYPPVLSVLALGEKLANHLENIDYDNNQFGKSDYGLGKSYGKMDGWWREAPKE